ncbi:hypothetical protein UFOVP823_16 [uncultured Caudovirales phage]|uniref:Gene product 88 domain-containing protein n=1 Tax=uncultured Caudovirales phage TaxID=2100421 RepID=A0A6J5P221_9CAUD|nr:hypothetical protein UFOVP823_16 [uncultured Caudovirales phage]
MKLLNIDANAKTIKGQAQGYMTAVLYLAPHTLAGVTLCPMAEKAGCVSGCLTFAGRAGIAAGAATMTAPNGAIIPANTIQKARLAKTARFHHDRAGFMLQLVREVRAFISKAKRKGLTPVVRLNGTSDIRWEVIPTEGAANIFAAFPDVQFYDYTKIPNRKVDGIANYHLSYSYSDRAEYQPYVRKAMTQGMNLVVVFRKEKPATFMGREVVDGDETDLRFADPTGVVVALKAKGRAKLDRSGFVVG